MLARLALFALFVAGTVSAALYAFSVAILRDSRRVIERNPVFDRPDDVDSVVQIIKTGATVAVAICGVAFAAVLFW